MPCSASLSCQGLIDMQRRQSASPVVPIFLCPGFAAPAKPSDTDEETLNAQSCVYRYWGEATRLGSPESPVKCVWPSGFLSMHDRACEIFYQIKGGKVDYGEEHSTKFGHQRFGRTYRGEYPKWSSDFPIHIVGHSFGGPTIRMLQHLLCVRAFPGHETHADWVLSLTAVNAPLNGSLVPHALGVKQDAAPGLVRPSTCFFLGSILHILAYMDIVQIFGYDLGFDHWRLSWRGPKEGRKSRSWRQSGTYFWRATQTLLSSLFYRSLLFEREDHVGHDCSVLGMARFNASTAVAHDCTFFISLVGTGTDPAGFPHRPDTRLTRNGWQKRWSWWLVEQLSWMLAMLLFLARRAFLWTISCITNQQSYAKLAKTMPHEDGFAVRPYIHYMGVSDGVVPVFSQSHPRIGVKSRACRVKNIPDTANDMERGIWYVQVQGHDHTWCLATNAENQRRSFLELFERLRSLQIAAPSAHDQSPCASQIKIGSHFTIAWICEVLAGTADYQMVFDVLGVSNSSTDQQRSSEEVLDPEILFLAYHA